MECKIYGDSLDSTTGTIDILVDIANTSGRAAEDSESGAESTVNDVMHVDIWGGEYF